MWVLDHKASIDPFYNLALEEYLFKKEVGDVLMLWQSENSIVIGKHQNAYREINLDVVNTKNIRVARRLSGGGAVYHDLGNLNFTFIQNGEKGKLVDFGRFLTPIIDGLKVFGLETYQGKRNEIMLKGMKISGNAEHTFKNRVLHHGTLLFNTDLNVLVQSLRINPFKYKDKAIKSVQSRVTNIADHVDPELDFKTFRQQLLAELMKLLPSAHAMDIKLIDPVEVERIKQDKYATWKWNFGYSPNYELQRTFDHLGNSVDLQLSVKRGIIEEVYTTDHELTRQLTRLTHAEHRPEVIEALLTEIDLVHLKTYFF